MQARTWHPPAGKLDARPHLKRRRLPYWTLLLLLPLQLNAQLPDDIGTGSLLLRMADGYRVSTALDTDVDINVNGLVARVSVQQSFENTGSEWVEGVYVFPLPDGAAVDQMRLRIGERVIEGEIREKAAAKKAYEQAKAQGKKTSLVEQQRANLFTTAVANIAPGESVVVEIEYLETVVYDAGTFHIRFPMTLTPRYMPGEPLADRQGSGWSADTDEVPDASLISPPMVSASDRHRISLDVFVDAGMPLDIIASRYHKVSIGEQNGRYSVTLDDPGTKLDHDFELLWRPMAQATPAAMSFSETVGGEDYYLLMLVPPAAVDAAPARMPRETIFIIDTSGSMHGSSIQQAKQALMKAVKAMQPGDRFNVIEFNSSMRPLFPDSVDSNFHNLRVAAQFVASLNANGGTEMRPALEYALRRPANETHLRQIVFITDGSVGNEAALFDLIERHLGGARLFTVGIGSAPNSWFMRKSAELGRGSFTVISATHEVEEKMDRLFDKIESPQVTGIEIDWPFAVEAYPSRVPDLYLGEPVSVRVRAADMPAAGGRIRVTGNTAAGPWSAQIPLSSGRNGFGIGALWARAKIAELMDAKRRGASEDAIRAAVVETALNHHLVSTYTSLVAVDRTPARPAGAPLAREGVPNLIAHGQGPNAIFGFPATATPTTQLALQGLATLLLAAAVFAWQRRRRHALA